MPPFISTLLLALVFLPLTTTAQTFSNYKVWGDTVFSSAHLGYDRAVTTTVPLEWQPGMGFQFPLIIIFDRQNTRSVQYILNTIDYLTSNEQMPASVVLTVESVEATRYRETLPLASSPEGLGEANERFIFEELIPFAEERLQAGRFRLLIGHSRYGFFTSYLFQKRLHDLNAVVSLSPFFEAKNVNLVDSFSRMDAVDLQTTKYYRYGIGGDYPEDFQAMEKTLATLKNPRLNRKGVLFPLADHNATPGLTIANALYDIFAFWTQQQNDYFDESNVSFEGIKTIQDNIEKHYGAPLSFGLGYLNGKGWQFFHAGKYELAISAWKLMLESYPNFSEGYLFIAQAEEQLGRDNKNTMDLFWQNLARSEFYTPEEKEEIRNEMK